MTWRYSTPEAREKRDAAIMEKWAMGWDHRDLAWEFDLTPQRIGQIINSFGVRERERARRRRFNWAKGGMSKQTGT